MNFSGSLATQCAYLSNDPFMVRPTLIDINPVELNYYPFMISLDKCNGSFNAVDNLSTKICVASETKDINVKACNMITRINEVKTLVKHISCDFKCKFNSATFKSNQKSNTETCHVSVKIIVRAKKIMAGILAHVFVKMVRILKVLLILE